MIITLPVNSMNKNTKIKSSIPPKNRSYNIDKMRDYIPLAFHEEFRFDYISYLSMLHDLGCSNKELSEYTKQLLKPLPYFKTLNNLSDLTKKLEDNYTNYKKRQILFFQIKNQIHELWTSTTDDLSRLALRLESYINITKSENLEIGHVKALREIFRILKTKREGGIEEIKQIMNEEKMRTLPKIKGLTNLYKPE